MEMASGATQGAVFPAATMPEQLMVLLGELAMRLGDAHELRQADYRHFTHLCFEHGVVTTGVPEVEGCK